MLGPSTVSDEIVLHPTTAIDLSAPTTAWGGGVWLVVWKRTLPSGSSSIEGLRLGPDGSVLDAPFTIINASPSSSLSTPAVAWGSTGFLVAALGGGTARVDAEGTTLDPTPLPEPPSWLSSHWPHLAFDGTGFVLAWAGYHMPDELTVEREIWGLRLNELGEPLSPDKTFVHDTNVHWPPGPFPFALAAAPPGWLLTAAGQPGLWGAMLDADGGEVHETALLSEISSIAVDLAHGPKRDLIVWTSTDDTIHLSELDLPITAGTTIDSVGAPTGDARRRAPAIAHDGHQFVVAWPFQDDAGEGGIRACRFDDEGAMLDPAPWVVSAAIGSHSDLDMARNDVGNSLVVYRRVGPDPSEAAIAARLLVLGPELVTEGSGGDGGAPSSAGGGVAGANVEEDPEGEAAGSAAPEMGSSCQSCRGAPRGGHSARAWPLASVFLLALLRSSRRRGVSGEGSRRAAGDRRRSCR